MELELRAGTHIDDAAQQAYTLALASGEEVTFHFNDVTLTATTETQPEDLVKVFHDENQRQMDAYQQTPDYDREQKRKAAMVQQYQLRVNELIAALPEAIQGGHTAVVQWILDFFTASNLKGVEYPVVAVIEPILAAGYQSGENVGMGEAELHADRTAMARWIIGQFLDCLKQVQCLPNALKYFAEQYLQ